MQPALNYYIGVNVTGILSLLHVIIIIIIITHVSLSAVASASPVLP